MRVGPVDARQQLFDRLSKDKKTLGVMKVVMTQCVSHFLVLYGGERPYVALGDEGGSQEDLSMFTEVVKAIRADHAMRPTDPTKWLTEFPNWMFSRPTAAPAPPTVKPR
ncbi:MAG: hypothetical protein P1U34_06270 [Coxiellaceae bacterium]|nr:hypothetical protein [Coxiellaceae bacterium]